MATSSRTKSKAGSKVKPRFKKVTPKAETHHAEKEAELTVHDGKLVVRLSRESHPEVFDLDRLTKQVRKMIETYNRKRSARDLCEFLQETEKSLQIILKNQLEDAMRKYLV